MKPTHDPATPPIGDWTAIPQPSTWDPSNGQWLAGAWKGFELHIAAARHGLRLVVIDVEAQYEHWFPFAVIDYLRAQAPFIVPAADRASDAWDPEVALTVALGGTPPTGPAEPGPATFGGRIFLETDSGSRDLIGEVSTPFPVTAETIRATFADGEGGQIGTIKHWLVVHEIGPDGEVDDRVCIPEAWRDQARALLEQGSILVLVEATAFDPSKMRVIGE